MLRIQALGGLSVFDGERPLAGAAKQPKRLALLALLARAGSRGVSRDRLLLMLWPDADEERARRGLNQALYALRQDLGEAAIAGSVDLRLDPALVTSDVQEFADARAAGRLEGAAVLWRGPFLDGFGLPGFPEFERWAEAEREALSHDYRELLELLATQSAGRGDAVAATGWWRRLAALDPHNGRVAESLMRALVAAGDVSGALRHADIFTALLEADLGLPPDRQIVALAERIRADATTRPAPPAPSSAPVTVASVIEPETVPTDESASAPAPAIRERAEPATSVMVTSGWAAVPLPATRDATPSGGQPAAGGSARSRGDIAEPARRGERVRVAVAGLALAAALGAVLLRSRSGAQPAGSATPRGGVVVAVGRIADYTRSTTGDRSAPLSDMLATNLARAAGLEVVSTSRMYELVAQLRRDGDSSDGAVARAARLAGATHLVDGALYEVSVGRLRLDLRRVDLASGSVKSAHTVEGTDLFVLADSGTRRIAAGAGGTAPEGSLASVTTTSEEAYRFYEAGLRAYVRGERGPARELFRSALKEDSTFAMAAYYVSRSADELAEMLDYMERARRLSERASPRERLTIRAAWAFLQNDPSFRAVAETLSIQFPTNLDGAYWHGQSLIREREYAAAVAPLRRVIQLDSLSLRGDAERCLACDAYQSLIYGYMAMDSFPAAARAAREWIAARPTSARALDYYADMLRLWGHAAEAEQAWQRSVANGLGPRDTWMRLATIAYHAEDWARMDSVLEAHLHQGTPPERWDAATHLAISLRAQGRFNEAIRVTMTGRQAFAGRPSERLATRGMMSSLAEALCDAGRHGEALAVLDSASRITDAREASTSAARSLRYMLLEEAMVRWRMRDTSGLARLADSLEVLNARFEMTRTRTLYAFPRALVLLERGQPADAVTQLRQITTMTSPITGLGMVHYAYGEALLAAGRPADAVAALQPLLRAYEGGPLLRTDYHEALARAWEAAGRRDSARAHWQAVARAWAQADTVLARRLARARARLAAR